METEAETLIGSCRQVLRQYGRDYAISALRGLAVRHMLSLSLPETTEGFYPIVKVHQMALRDLEEVFYRHVESGTGTLSREDLIMALVNRQVWQEDDV